MQTNNPSKKFHLSTKDIPNLCIIFISAFIYSCGMNSFIKSGNLFPGGFAGLARLLSAMTSTFLHMNISFSYFYFGLNTIVTLIVFRMIGHKFIAFSILWYTLTSIFTSVLVLPQLTNEMLLIAVFGGLVNGGAIGMALRANASSGGTDFIAIALSMKINRPTWNYMMAANACILLIAGYLYGWNTALYSIIFQFVSTQVVNQIHLRYKLTTLHIITDKPDDVCNAIFHIVRHGITKIPCRGGFTNQEHTLLLTTINAYQCKHVVDAARMADPKAFIEEGTVNRIVGNYFQQPLE